MNLLLLFDHFPQSCVSHKNRLFIFLGKWHKIFTIFLFYIQLSFLCERDTRKRSFNNSVWDFSFSFSFKTMRKIRFVKKYGTWKTLLKPLILCELFIKVVDFASIFSSFYRLKTNLYALRQQSSRKLASCSWEFSIRWRNKWLKKNAWRSEVHFIFTATRRNLIFKGI